MFLFRRRETPRHFYPPGADPTLDRPIPQRARGLPCAGIVLTVLVLAFGIVLFLMSRQTTAKQVVWVTETPGGLAALAPLPAQTELPTFAPTSTLDNWSLTGTALFFATSTATPTQAPPPDWCYFLTPSPTVLATIYVTPDSFQLAATAVLLQTGTPTQTMTPTDVPPRAWCNSYIPGPDAAAMTATQRAWPTAAQLPPITPPPTWTRVPPPVIHPQPAAAQPAAPKATDVPPPPPTQPPQVIILTSPPQVIIIQSTAQEIIVTATQRDTDTATATATLTATDTETMTDVPSHTPAATDTPTDQPTATDVPTDTPTDTQIPPTDVPTATLMPTNIPSTVTPVPQSTAQVTPGVNP